MAILFLDLAVSTFHILLLQGWHLTGIQEQAPVNGLAHLTHPENMDPVVVGAEIHAELDQELAHLQHRQFALMLHGLASLGPSYTAGIAARALPSLPRNTPQHPAEEQPCSGLALLAQHQ